MKPLSKKSIEAINKIQNEVNQAVIDIHLKNKAHETIDQTVKRKFSHLSNEELIRRANAAADFCWDDEGAEIDRRMRDNGLKCEMQGNRIVILN